MAAPRRLLVLAAAAATAPVRAYQLCGAAPYGRAFRYSSAPRATLVLEAEPPIRIGHGYDIHRMAPRAEAGQVRRSSRTTGARAIAPFNRPRQTPATRRPARRASLAGAVTPCVRASAAPPPHHVCAPRGSLSWRVA